jgi:glycosyltransferase involved in cell wall biosynthesis
MGGESSLHSPTIWVVVPALNEEESLPLVLDALPKELGCRVVVCDNGSTDATPKVARGAGATVVREEQRGYGIACLTALSEVRGQQARDEDIVVFLDADFSDDPTQLPELIAPLLEDRADLVIGSRVLGRREEGALLPQARWGNWLATRLIDWITGVRFTDLGPFRAIRWGGLESLRMEDEAFGWTVEMQLKAASWGLRCTEVPVDYRVRVGQSKITGTVRGTVLASATILSILARWAWRKHRATPASTLRAQ